MAPMGFEAGLPSVQHDPVPQRGQTEKGAPTEEDSNTYSILQHYRQSRHDHTAISGSPFFSTIAASATGTLQGIPVAEAAIMPGKCQDY